MDADGDLTILNGKLTILVAFGHGENWTRTVKEIIGRSSSREMDKP